MYRVFFLRWIERACIALRTLPGTLRARVKLKQIVNIAVLGLLVGIAALIFMIYFEIRSASLASVETTDDRHGILVKDRLGRMVLRISTDTEISTCKLVKELIVVCYKKDGEKAGYIEAYNRKGEIIWDDNTCVAGPHGYDVSGGSGRFWVKDAIVTDLDGDGTSELIVVAGDQKFSPNRIILYSPESGERLGEFLNLGDIGPVKVFDMDQDGVKEVLVRAINNSLGQARLEDGRVIYTWTAFLFSGTDLRGVAPLWGNPSEAHKSSLHWYILATPFELNGESVDFLHEIRYSDPDISFSKKLPDGTTAAVIYIQAGFMYYFDKDGYFRGGGWADKAEPGWEPPDLFKVETTPYYYTLINTRTGESSRVEQLNGAVRLLE